FPTALVVWDRSLRPPGEPRSKHGGGGVYLISRATLGNVVATDERASAYLVSRSTLFVRHQHASPQTMSTQRMRSRLGASFADVNTGTAVGFQISTQMATILRTVDGGATWTPQFSGTSAFLNSVSFVDANTGWLVGDKGTILHTTTGGE